MVPPGRTGGRGRTITSLCRVPLPESASGDLRHRPAGSWEVVQGSSSPGTKTVTVGKGFQLTDVLQQWVEHKNRLLVPPSLAAGI